MNNQYHRKISHLTKLLSYLATVTLAKRHSIYSQTLEVSVVNGKVILNAPHVNYSYGSLHDLFSATFREMNIARNPPEYVLILGYGAGSVASILNSEYNLGCRITGVEVDPEVLRLSKMYFRPVPGTGIIHADADEFIRTCRDTFDLIVIDIYHDQITPPQFEQPDFLHFTASCLKPAGRVLFNKYIYDEHAEQEAIALRNRFYSIFEHVEVISAGYRWMNWMILGQKT